MRALILLGPVAAAAGEQTNALSVPKDRQSIAMLDLMVQSRPVGTLVARLGTEDHPTKYRRIQPNAWGMVFGMAAPRLNNGGALTPETL
jgi:hypothetical protein